MSDQINALREEINRLNQRLNRANRDKANLEMAVNLIHQVTESAEVTDVIDHILQILVSTIGGTNISLYYNVVDQWHYVDILGNRSVLETIDDDLVQHAIATQTFQKRSQSIAPEQTISDFRPNYETWVYPLRVKNYYFGAIRLKGMAIEHAHYRENIDPFIRYSSLILYHEITNLKKLQEAYLDTKKAKKALQNAKERFELAMKFANDGLFDWNLKTNEIYYSPVWKSLLGYQEHEIKNDFSEWERLTHPQDVKESWTMLKEVLSGERDRFEKELKMLHKDGHWVDILSRAKVIFNDKGEGARVVGTHVDISRQKRLEKKLRESESKYRSILESARDPTFICSEDRKIEYMNPAMIKWMGRDCTGENCFEVINQEKSICSWCSFNTVKQHQSDSQEYVSPRDNRRYMISNSPIVNDDGSVSKLTVLSDITELFDMKRRLNQAQKMESIGNLAGGIAHDFNNILTSILGFTELAMDHPDATAEIEDSLQEVYNAGKRAKTLVRQILAFARRSDEALKPVQLDGMINEVLSLLRSSIPTTVEIRRRIKTSAHVLGNQTQLHQVILNLCTNAAQAMEEHGGVLTVSLDTEMIDEIDATGDFDLNPGEYAILTVSDNGIGIPEDIIDSIFEPYFTTKKPGEGTGMGLAVVHGIVESSGGKIDVNSVLGKGTVFTIFLPTVVQKETGNTKVISTMPGGSERILFVDDEPPIARMNSRLLSKLGYTVTTLTNSLEAMALFESDPHSFDLVITDMTMPGLTGDALARALMEIRPELPVIICTGFSKKATEKNVREIGVKALLFKPTAKTELAQTIRNVLDTHMKQSEKSV